MKVEPAAQNAADVPEAIGSPLDDVQSPPGKGSTSKGHSKQRSAHASTNNSGDRDERPEVPSRRFYCVWLLCVVTCGLVTIPLALLLIPVTLRAHLLTPLPPQTLAPEVVVDDPVRQSGLSRQQFCTLQLQVDNRSAPKAAPSNPFTGNTQHRQYREVFCVFDTKYYRTAGAVYLPVHVPFDFCSSLIYSSVALLYDRVQWRRPEMDEAFVAQFLAPPGTSPPVRHRGRHLPVYLTLGGEPEDGANFTKVFRDDERLFRFTHYVAHFLVDYGFTGLHVDWDHPHGACGDRSDKANLLRFAQMLRGHRPERLLLLSLRPDRMHHYGLEQLLPLLTYVVVATHRLNRHLATSLVQCSARGDLVARVMFNVRSRFPDMWQYFIYSVSAGADTFTTAGSAQLGEPSKGPSSFDYYTRQPQRTRYDLVCELPRGRRGTDDECAVAYKPIRDTIDIKVAAFAGPKEIRARLHRAYDLNLGDTPIVVYDIDLDDFEGKCPGGVKSPQIEAYATAYFDG